ncbi:MAG TPA: type II toxin-antitoxin system HicB family antitoxin [Dokdonella sp.]
MKYRYPVTLTRDADGGFTVTFPDLPEGITQGDTEEEAFAEARDCLDEVLASRVNDQESIPQPSRVGKFAVEPSAQIAAKVALYEAFRESGINRSALARKLSIAETEVRRMLDPHHPTKLPRIEGALSVLGKKIRIEVVNA